MVRENAKRLVAITRSGQSVSLAYDTAGRLASTVLPDGIVESYVPHLEQVERGAFARLRTTANVRCSRLRPGEDRVAARDHRCSRDHLHKGGGGCPRVLSRRVGI